MYSMSLGGGTAITCFVRVSIWRQLRVSQPYPNSSTANASVYCMLICCLVVPDSFLITPQAFMRMDENLTRFNSLFAGDGPNRLFVYFQASDRADDVSALLCTTGALFCLELTLTLSSWRHSKMRRRPLSATSIIAGSGGKLRRGALPLGCGEVGYARGFRHQ